MALAIEMKRQKDEKKFQKKKKKKKKKKKRRRMENSCHDFFCMYVLMNSIR